MTRAAMREKVLGEMVVARDRQIQVYEKRIAELKRLNVQQGEKIEELLVGLEDAERVIGDAGLMLVGEEFCGCRLCD